MRVVIPNDDHSVLLELTGPVLYVAHGGYGSVHVYYEFDESAPKTVERFTLFGTGQTLPNNVEYVDTVETDREVLHLYQDKLRLVTDDAALEGESDGELPGSGDLPEMQADGFYDVSRIAA